MSSTEPRALDSGLWESDLLDLRHFDVTELEKIPRSVLRVVLERLRRDAADADAEFTGFTSQI